MEKLRGGGGVRSDLEQAQVGVEQEHFFLLSFA